MRILITGAAGLYGVHLVDLLVKRSDVSKVFGVDNFSREFAVADPFVNGSEFTKKFVLVKQDYQLLTVQQLNEMSPDVVVHLAASVSIDESMEKSSMYFFNNEYGTFQFMQNLLKVKSRPIIIYGSSAEVYGNPRYTPIDENHPMFPRSVYAVSKLASEKHCRAMYEWYEYPVIVIRNFNTYGENQNLWGYSAVIPSFIERALKGEPLVVSGNGEQTRDFMYVKDAARAYEMVIQNASDLVGETLNIGTGVQTKIEDLAHMIKELTKTNAPIVRGEGRPGDLVALEADATRIKTVTYWQPVYTMEDGLQRTIDWYTSVL